MKRSRGGQILAIILLLNVGLMGCRSALIPIPTKNPVPPGMPLADVRLLIALSIDPLAKANWNTTSTPSHTVLQEMFADGQSNP